MLANETPRKSQISSLITVLALRLALHTEIKLTRLDDSYPPPSTASITFLSAQSKLLHPNTLPKYFLLPQQRRGTTKRKPYLTSH